MLKVHMSDGRTLSYDLRKSKEFQDWKKNVMIHNFQKMIRGIGIVYNTQWYALPIPKKFQNVFFDGDLVVKTDSSNGRTKLRGEKIICHFDDVQLSLIVYYGKRPKMARIDVIKMGRQRFIVPQIDLGGNKCQQIKAFTSTTTDETAHKAQK